MSSSSQAPELSMDEILASIRRIISEEPRTPAPAAPVNTTARAHAARTEPVLPAQTSQAANLVPAQSAPRLLDARPEGDAPGRTTRLAAAPIASVSSIASGAVLAGAADGRRATPGKPMIEDDILELVEDDAHATAALEPLADGQPQYGAHAPDTGEMDAPLSLNEYRAHGTDAWDLDPLTAQAPVLTATLDAESMKPDPAATPHRRAALPQSGAATAAFEPDQSSSQRPAKPSFPSMIELLKRQEWPQGKKPGTGPDTRPEISAVPSGAMPGMAPANAPASAAQKPESSAVFASAAALQPTAPPPTAPPRAPMAPVSDPSTPIPPARAASAVGVRVQSPSGGAAVRPSWLEAALSPGKTTLPPQAAPPNAQPPNAAAPSQRAPQRPPQSSLAATAPGAPAKTPGISPVETVLFAGETETVQQAAPARFVADVTPDQDDEAGTDAVIVHAYVAPQTPLAAALNSPLLTLAEGAAGAGTSQFGPEQRVMTPSARAMDAPYEPPAAPAQNAITAALATPTTPAVRTLEDTVSELMRPLLRQWLDDNMPRIVEKAFREELAGRTGTAVGKPVAKV